MRESELMSALARVVSTLILSLVAVTAPASVATAGETALIDQATLLQRINEENASMIVLDVRTPEEFAAGHVPGAINIPHTQLPDRISELPSAGQQDIVVYCATGVRAEKAATIFREKGFTRLLHLEGDMKLWREKHQPLESEPAANPPEKAAAEE